MKIPDFILIFKTGFLLQSTEQVKNIPLTPV